MNDGKSYFHESSGFIGITVEIVPEIPAGVPTLDVPLVNIRLLVTVTLFSFEILKVGLV